MKTISSSEFRNNQKKYFEIAEKERVVIYRGVGKRSFVLTPADEMDETDYLMADPEGREKLLRAITEVNNGKYSSLSEEEAAMLWN